MYLTIIGQRIRESRQRAGMTIEQLAAQCGLTTGYVGNIERAYDLPSLKALLDTANALGVSFDYLLGSNLQFNKAHARTLDDSYHALKHDIKTLSPQEREFISSVIQQLHLLRRAKNHKS